MPLEKLSREQLQNTGTRSTADPAYVKFLKDLKAGEGGRTDMKNETVTRQTVKNRLQRAADEMGMEVKFLRSSADEVRFKVVSAAEVDTGRRGRGRG
jgi:hypothetical protein